MTPPPPLITPHPLILVIIVSDTILSLKANLIARIFYYWKKLFTYFYLGQFSEPHWFMSDMAPQFYDAFCKVFNCHPIRLYCVWHVDKAWKEQLKEKVKDLEIYANIYKQLRTLLEQTNIDIFNQYLTSFTKMLTRSHVTKRFGDYFLEHWILKKETWAYCYRVGLGINTNMFCESFHKVFKYSYLKGKVNKRVDRCLVNLLKFNRDKTFERVIKLTKGKCTQKIKAINERHQASLKMSFNSVTENDENDGGKSWFVRSEDGKQVYSVDQRDDCTETQCKLRCSECDICYHFYVCTCPDFLIYSSVCKHIHLLHRYRLINDNSFMESVEAGNCNMLPNAAEVGEKEKITAMLSNPHIDTFEQTRIRTESVLLELLSHIRCSTRNHADAVSHVLKQATALKNTFISMRNNKNVYQLKPLSSGPHNKGIEKQRRFFSTTKKRKTANIKLAKPTAEEKEKLLKEILDESEKEENVATNVTIAKQNRLSAGKFYL